MSTGRKPLVRVPPDEDLTFLFSDPEAIGVGCNLGALASEEGLVRADRSPDARMTDRRVGRGSTVERARALRRRFAELDQRSRNVLWLAYGPHRWPTMLSSMGGLAGVALLTETVKRGAASRKKTAEPAVSHVYRKEGSNSGFAQETGLDGSVLRVWTPGGSVSTKRPSLEGPSQQAIPESAWLLGAREAQREAVLREAGEMLRLALVAWWEVKR